MLGLAIIAGAWTACALWCVWFVLTVENDLND
jgi:hypothetical protein